MPALPADKVLVGASAARVHGLDLGRDYVEIAVPPSSGVRSRRGLIVRHVVFPPGEVVSVKQVRVTSLHRTLRDLCIAEPAVEALIAIDMALHLRRTTWTALEEYVGTVAGLPGAKRLRRLITLAAPAESPMETRLRWLLISARLPRPEVQTNLYGSDGDFVGRADLYYPAARMVVEFDGGNHRERLVTDDRRQNLLINAGYRVLRFTSADIYQRPDIVTAQVRGGLSASQR
jgi:very-short-patch-repair endonuclease